MPIENINLLQNDIDLKGLMRDNDYYVQALANLGQRTSLNAQSIKYNTFKFKDVFTNADDVYSSDDYIGVMTKTSDVIQFHIVDKRTLSQNYQTFRSVVTSVEEHNIDDKLLFNNNISFNMTVNNVDKISSIGSTLGVKDDYFTSNLRTKLLGTDDKDDDNIEAQWTKIDLTTGALHSAARVFHLKDDDYVMLTIRPDVTRSDDHVRYYHMSCYVLNTDTIIDDDGNKNVNVVNNFKAFFKYSTSESSIESSYRSGEWCDASLDELLYYDEDGNPPTNIYAFMNKYRYYQEIENYTILLKYDTLKNVRLSIADESVLNYQYNNIDEIMKYDTLGLYHRLTCLNDDLEITFPNLLNLWTTNLFNHDHTTFVRRIFIKLYEKLYDDYVDYEVTSGNKPGMFIPLNYRFNYISDGSNVLYLYYTDDLYVSLINFKQFNTQELYEFLLKHDNVIFNYDDVDKVKIFNVFTQRNRKYDEYIDNIIVNERYTLPYVNAQNAWQINDVDTHIRAVGLNAGKPNIIILKQIDVENSEEGHHYDVLHSSELYRMQQCDEQFDDTLGLYFPVINANNIDMFENALLVYVLDGTTKFYRVDENRFRIIKENENDDESGELTIKSLFNVTQTIIDTISDTNIAKSNKFDLITFDDETAAYVQQVDDVMTSPHFTVKQQRIESSDNKSNCEMFIYRGNRLDEEEYLVNDVLMYGDKHLNRYIEEVHETFKDYPDYEYVTEQVRIPVVDVTEDMTHEQYISMLNERTHNMFVTTFERIGESSVDDGFIVYSVSGYKCVNDKRHDDYVPTAHVPMVKLSEVFLRDVNVVNRTNVISFDGDGDMYYSYLGTTYDDDDKTTLHLGTGERDINIGNMTMATPDHIDDFKKHDKISVDFDEIHLNSKRLKSNSTLMENHDVDGRVFTTIDTDPLGTCRLSAADVCQYSVNSENNDVIIRRRAVNNGNSHILDNMFIVMRTNTSQQSMNDKYFLNLNRLFIDYGIDLMRYTLDDEYKIKLYYTMRDTDGNEIRSHVDSQYDSYRMPIDNIYTSSYNDGVTDKYFYLLYIGEKIENTLSTIGDDVTLKLLRDIFITTWTEDGGDTICVDVNNKNEFNPITIEVWDTLEGENNQSTGNVDGGYDEYEQP